MTDLSIPEIAPGEDALTAAMAYARCGWYVLPVKRGSKHPGSVVGDKWQAWSSRDPAQIAAWFDVDAPGKVPERLATALRGVRPPCQSTRPDEERRGHYLFRQPGGRTVGNSTGELGPGWGEVRGANGVIVDPFCGSGATLEAAEIEGVRAIGIDSDAHACALTRARLASGVVPRVS